MEYEIGAVVTIFFSLLKPVPSGDLDGTYTFSESKPI